MKKSIKSVLLIYIIILVLYNTLFWFIPFEKSAPSIIEYVFTMLASVIGLAATYYSFKGSDSKSKFYGYPIFRIAFIYVVVQLIVGVIINIVTLIQDVEPWIVVITSVLLLGCALIGIIVANNTKDTIVTLEEKTQAATKQMKLFRLDVSSIYNNCDDADVKKAMKHLKESFEYSDPVTNIELAKLESDISDEVSLLSATIKGDKQQTLLQIEKIEKMLADRNRRCKALK